jgi:hypothetical protein
MKATQSRRQSPLSLAPGFSPVLPGQAEQNRFNGFVGAVEKPLKRFLVLGEHSTGPKPGANERHHPLANRVIVILLFAGFVLCGTRAFAQSTASNSIRFQPVEIFADSGTNTLAAYQLQFNVTSGNAKIVGIEGGEHPAFAEAPFYDPKAMQNERVILAAFSTQQADKLPTGKTRVATIHLQISGTDELKFETKLTTAANSGGKKIAATISATEKRAK